MPVPEQQTALLAVLEEARGRGLLGPGPVDRQVAHSRGFAWALETAGIRPPTELLDLGSGGGIPGLVLALEWPAANVALLDVGVRRADFLRRAVQDCGLADRVTVLEGRAEDLGRDPDRRAAFQLVVARSFGPPAVTAECAAPFLEVGGVLVVSEKPASEQDENRWSQQGLDELGLGGPSVVRDKFSYAVIPQVSRCPDRFPRRVGVPEKRPLF